MKKVPVKTPSAYFKKKYAEGVAFLFGV